MSYAYDIVLNFNSELYEFFEWNKEDIIYHIKKINIFLVDSKSYNDIFDNIVLFNKDFLSTIYNKCEYYSNRKLGNISYAFLLTDSYRVIGIILDSSGKIIKYSSLLLDDEEDVLDLSHKIEKIKLDYKIISRRNKNEFQTRREKNIIKYIKNDLVKEYRQNNISKLRYLYYEYFNKSSDDIDKIYQDLLNELENSIDDKHYHLYNLIKLSYSGKNV